MPALCLYFQVHQPYRLRPFSFFEAGCDCNFFDTALNRQIMQRVASRCYIPTGLSLLRACRRHGERLRLTFSITGTAVEQMREYAPEALAVFKDIAATGYGEFLGETYYHSLASLLPDQTEFREQVRLHSELMEREFGVRPKVFRNTELIFSDSIGQEIQRCGFRGVFVEGIVEQFAGRSPNAIYRAHDAELTLLPRNFWLSDLLAFRMHTGGPAGSRLTVTDFVKHLKSHADGNDVLILCLDYETFGEHHQGTVGVCDFLEQLAAQLLEDPSWRFITPSEIVAERVPVGELSFPVTRSWADQSRDLSPWQGNQMQRSALQRLYSETISLRCPLDTWRKLQTSDHFYYMSNKGGSDGVVHQYFRPFESPYDAFVTYMNVLRAIEQGSEVSRPRANTSLASP